MRLELEEAEAARDAAVDKARDAHVQAANKRGGTSLPSGEFPQVLPPPRVSEAFATRILDKLPDAQKVVQAAAAVVAATGLPPEKGNLSSEPETALEAALIKLGGVDLVDLVVVAPAVEDCRAWRWPPAVSPTSC